MRIKTNYGSDTGMYLVDVYLETERECALETEEIWKELAPHFASEQISISDVVDCFLLKRDSDSIGDVVNCFLHKRDSEGNWVSRESYHGEVNSRRVTCPRR